MNKPNFFIVGAPRCGTTALWTFLKQHPEIFMSSLKEPQFFAPDILGDIRNVRTWPQYLEFFADAPPRARIGEASVCYLGSVTAPREIKAFSPDARIIVMLRNPVDMMYSLYEMRRYQLYEPFDTFEAALAADERADLGRPQWNGRRFPQLRYREEAECAKHLGTYFEVFGRERVHVIIYDDFAKDTGASYRETLRFLEVDTAFRPAFEVINANHRARSRMLTRLLLRPPQWFRKIVHPVTTLAMRRFGDRILNLLNVKYERRPPLDSGLRVRLLNEYTPEIETLSRLLDRDLSGWYKK